MELSFFVRILGDAKVKEILEKYIIDNVTVDGQPVLARRGRPIGSVNKFKKSKKKKFIFGIHKWTDDEDIDLLVSVDTLMKQGMKKSPAFDVVARKFGVSGAAAREHYKKLTKNDPTVSTTTNQEAVPSRTQGVENAKQDQVHHQFAQHSAGSR